ncbi:MAG: nicotinate-nucleotide adenylyltransferase [Thermoleophilia bacterium]
MPLTKIAIMGGTFNPIHIGHLVCAEEAVSQYGLDRVLFMPTGTPPHKDIEAGVSSEDRFRMTEIATFDNPRFEVSRYEIDKKQVCYTVDTVRHLKNELPEAELFFITGTDAVVEILEWKDPEETLQLATLIAATRPGFPLDRIPERIRELMDEGRVRVMEIPCIGVSSSLVRERVAAGRSIRYLVPEGVERFIEKERLYL